ncbi:hypothetical protein JCM3775_003693 [Rhodotorula graminis]
MDDTVTIRTADDPPVELKPSRVVLMAGSRVFADMFSLPRVPAKRKGAPAVADAFDVAEKRDELELFLKLLNIAHEKEDPVAEMLSLDWPVVARLADKYDAAGVKALALGRCWQWQAQGTPEMAAEASAAFHTARLVKEQVFTTQYLFNMLDLLNFQLFKKEIDSCRADFLSWVESLRTHAMTFLLKEPTPWSRKCHCVGTGQAVYRAAWYEGIALDVDAHYRQTAPLFPV